MESVNGMEDRQIRSAINGDMRQQRGNALVIVLLVVGLIVGVVLVQNRQIFSSRASSNVAAAFDIKDAQTGATINCTNDNGTYVCKTSASQVSFRVQSLEPIYALDGAKGCDNELDQSCYYPNSGQRVFRATAYGDGADSINADCKDCMMPRKIIPHIFDQTDVDVPESEQHPEWSCIRGSLDRVDNSSCGPTSFSMVVEAMTGKHDNQTANNYTRLFLNNNMMQCTAGTDDYNVANYAKTNSSALQVKVLGVQTGSFEDLEQWYRDSGYPIWTAVYYLRPNGTRSPHYATVAAISDNYVWLADPYHPPADTMLKIPIDNFKNQYFRNRFTKIVPINDNDFNNGARPIREYPGCPTKEQLERNADPKSCSYKNPPIKLSSQELNADRLNELISGPKGNKFVAAFRGPLGSSQKAREELWSRLQYIITKANVAKMNPAIFIGYWWSESQFSTQGTRDMGCTHDDGLSDRARFEEEVRCAMAIEDYGNPERNAIANCFRSNDANSLACQTLKQQRTREGFDKNHPVSYPIKSFDDFFESYGPYDHLTGGEPTNCTHSYNQVIETAKELGMCSN